MTVRFPPLSAWENRNRTISGGSTTVIFTSDALKRIRREERRKTPPEIAPKPPRNHPLLLHQARIDVQRVFEGFGPSKHKLEFGTIINYLDINLTLA